MKLRSLDVRNFRSLREWTVTFKEFNVLVGKNDAGKSNVLAAIQLLCEGTPSSITEEDFYDLDSPIEIRATFGDVRRHLDLCDANNRPRLAERISDRDEIMVRRISDGRKLGKLEIRNPDGTFGLPVGIEAALKPIIPELIYIGALDDVAEQTKGTQKDALGKLLAQVIEPVSAEVEPALEEALAAADRLLNVQGEHDDRSAPLKDIEREISNYLHETFPHAGIRLKIGLPTIRDVLAKVEVLVTEGACVDRPAMRGHGLQRSLYLSLLRALAARVRAGRRLGRPFILLFEEPEAFLHPDAQSKMREALKGISRAAQVVFATHSPVLISPDSINCILRVEKCREAGDRKPYTRVHGPITLDGQRVEEREIAAIFALQRSSRFLFSRRVLLVEGVADEHIFAAAAKRVCDFDLEENEFAIVEMGGKGDCGVFIDVLRRLELNVWAVVDLDFAWKGAGQILGGNANYLRFLEALRAAVPDPPEGATEQEKRVSKQNRFQQCRGALRDDTAAIAGLLEQHRILMLLGGEIEDYAGVGQRSKGKYIKIAQEILTGTRDVHYQDDIRRKVELLRR